jgi:hypothetical protein
MGTTLVIGGKDGTVAGFEPEGRMAAIEGTGVSVLTVDTNKSPTVGTIVHTALHRNAGMGRQGKAQKRL